MSYEDAGSILRSRRATGYSHINNDLFNDPDLDWEHKGMLAFLLSKPDGWKIQTSYLITQTNSSGRDRVRRILRELEEIGYIIREKHRTEFGTYYWTSEIIESLSLRNGDNFTPKYPKKKPRTPPSTGSSRDGKPGAGSPGSIVITELVITENINTSSINSVLINAHTREESANAEAGLIFQSDSLNPLEDSLKSVKEEIHQPPSKDGKQSILEGNQTTIVPSLVSNPDLSLELGSATPRTSKPDKNTTIFGKPTLKASQRDRAQKASHIDRGIQNKRWKDRADFEKFRDYAIEWARQRREGATKGTPGQKYDDAWVETVLSRTATCTIEDSPILTCWKAWVTAAPASEVVESKPNFLPIIQTSPETLARFEAFKLQAAKEQAQREADEAARQARLNDWRADWEAECA